MINLIPYESTEGYIALSKADGGKQFLQKLTNDVQLNDAEKENFLEYLKDYRKSKNGDIKKHCCNYFQNGKKFMSANSFNGDRDQPFIRIKDVLRFVEWIGEIVESDITGTFDVLLDNEAPENLRQIAMNTLLNTEIRDELINEPEISLKYLGVKALPAGVSPILSEAKTDGWMVWSFPLSDDDLLSDKNLKTLDCRAGLSENKKLDKIVYKHNIKNCKDIKKPTLFDAEFYPQFEVGGKTKPLKGCEKMEGFDEYVHEPNFFKNILDTPLLIKK